MKHKFSARELLLIVIAAFLAVGIFYYEFVYKSVNTAIQSHDTASLVDQLTIAQAKASSEEKMKKTIADETANPSTGKVEVYNNLANEVNELGRILNGNAQEVSITWASPTLTDTTVRRAATIAFKAGTYDTARSLIKSINDMRYKNSIDKISVMADTNNSDNTVSYTVNMSLTFFETVNGATSTEGLITQDTTSTTK